MYWICYEINIPFFFSKEKSGYNNVSTEQELNDVKCKLYFLENVKKVGQILESVRLYLLGSLVECALVEQYMKLMY